MAQPQGSGFYVGHSRRDDEIARHTTKGGTNGGSISDAEAGGDGAAAREAVQIREREAPQATTRRASLAQPRLAASSAQTWAAPAVRLDADAVLDKESHRAMGLLDAPFC
jgi:hypothetical protein